MLFKNPFESLTALGSCVQIIDIFKGMQKNSKNVYIKSMFPSMLVDIHSMNLIAYERHYVLKFLTICVKQGFFWGVLDEGNFFFPTLLLPYFLVCIYFNCIILYHILYLHPISIPCTLFFVFVSISLELERKSRLFFWRWITCKVK